MAYKKKIDHNPRETGSAPMTGMKSQPLATHAPRQWLAHAILSAAVLEPLYELNRQWLALLALAPRFWAVSTNRARWPDPVSAGLVTLTPERRTEVARCPFSLFTARFKDGPYWLGIAGNTAVHEPQPSTDDASIREALTGFSELALFYAWHLTHANPPAARIILGMSDQTLSAFEALSLTSLQRLAGSSRDLFAPRWPERSAFWLRLLEALPETAGVVDIRLLGLQMLAAELSADPAPDSRHTTRR